MSAFRLPVEFRRRMFLPLLYVLSRLQRVSFPKPSSILEPHAQAALRYQPGIGLLLHLQGPSPRETARQRGQCPVAPREPDQVASAETEGLVPAKACRTQS